MVNPIIGMKRLTKVLLDGDSSLNIMYTETLDAMGINRARIWPTGAPFHGIVPKKQVVPLGQIDLAITFGDSTNYRMETLKGPNMARGGVNSLFRKSTNQLEQFD